MKNAARTNTAAWLAFAEVSARLSQAQMDLTAVLNLESKETIPGAFEIADRAWHTIEALRRELAGYRK